jgi:hypothetical protein
MMEASAVPGGEPSAADPQAALAALAESANERLEEAARNGANQAFNLGCTLTLLPGLVIVVLLFLLTRFNWVVALVATSLVVLGSVGFANLVAYRTKTNTLLRTYERDIFPEIERALKGLDLPRSRFDQVAAATLPENAALRAYLQREPPPGEG